MIKNKIAKRIRFLNKFSSQNAPQEIQSILPDILKLAQEEYDKWEQDEEGYAEGYGYGGICHLIAEQIANRISANGIICTTVSSDHEVHVYTVIRLPKSSQNPGVYQIDIRPYIYESGGGYTWKKLPDVIFDESDIEVSRLSPDPRDFKEYIGEWEEEASEEMEEEGSFIPRN